MKKIMVLALMLFGAFCFAEKERIEVGGCSPLFCFGEMNFHIYTVEEICPVSSNVVAFKFLGNSYMDTDARFTLYLKKGDLISEEPLLARFGRITNFGYNYIEYEVKD